MMLEMKQSEDFKADGYTTTITAIITTVTFFFLLHSFSTTTTTYYYSDEGKKYTKKYSHHEYASSLTERIQEKLFRERTYFTIRAASIISIVLTAVIFILFLRTQLLFGMLKYWNVTDKNDAAVVSNFSYHGKYLHSKQT